MDIIKLIKKAGIQTQTDRLNLTSQKLLKINDLAES